MEIDVIPNNLGEMDDEVWEMFSTGAEQKYKKRIREEKKAEKERLAVIEADKVERDRIEAENEKLRLEKLELEEKRKKLLKSNTEKAVTFLSNNGFVFCVGGMNHATYNWFIGSAHYSELETEKELDLFKKETLLTIQSHIIEAKSMAKLKQEREARDKLEREAREKEEAEKKAESDRLEAEKKATNAPDKDKILAYLQALDNVPVPELSTSIGKSLMINIEYRLAEFHESINEEVEECLN